MPRATTKADLLKMADEQFDKLWKIIDGMSEEKQNADFGADMVSMGKEAHWGRDKNLRDVLVHLHEWHNLFLKWEKSNAAGITVSFLPAPYSWKSYGEMNTLVWKQNQETTLAQAKQQVKESHKKVRAVIEKYTDEQLFTKAYYKWTGTSSLGQYCISTLPSHYDWAIKKLSKAAKI